MSANLGLLKAAVNSFNTDRPLGNTLGEQYYAFENYRLIRVGQVLNLRY